MKFGRWLLVVVVGWAGAAVGWAGPPDAGGVPPRSAPSDRRRVTEPDLPVRVQPSDRAFATGHLRSGAEVTVLSDRDGWAEIEAPAETFLWVDADGVRNQPDGPSVAIARRATLRYAAEGADRLGPPHPLGVLPGGTVVRLVDQPEVVVAGGRRSQTWLAVAPPEGEVRFVPSNALAARAEAESQPPRRPGSAERGRSRVDPDLIRAGPESLPGGTGRPERLASFEPSGPAVRPGQTADDLANLPPEVVAELTAIAAEVRAIRARPIESWNFTAIQDRYEALLRRFGSDAAVRSVVQGRLATIQATAAAGRAASDLDRIFNDGDRRDAEVDDARRRLAAAQGKSERGFDATGWLHPSSRRFQGQPVLSLIGPEGTAIGFVQIPLGVPSQRYLTHRVGIRGPVRFDPTLNARLISARDVEILDLRR